MAHNKMQAVQYEVTNNAAGTTGGERFANEIGVDYSKRTLESITSFIWNIFEQSTAADRKPVQSMKMVVEPNDNGGVAAYASGNDIHVNSNYIASSIGDVKREITGVLYHEATHIWQWNGNGNANGGLIEGIADFVRLKANYVPSHWVKPGAGERWDQGYDVTAYFLDYCNSLRSGFVADLNRKMETGYSDNFFFELLGKTVDQLWSDYKAQVTQAVTYEVTNNAVGTIGGDRFDNEIGVDYSKSTLESATSFIWNIFEQSREADRRRPQSIKMFVRQFESPNGVAYSSNDEIHVNAEYIARFSGDVKREITGILYHVVTYSWQWNGNNNANPSLIQGIADFVRLKANYAPSHWVKPGAGNKWDQGFDVTAHFLDYCNSLKNGFVAELNKKMKTGYRDNFFLGLLGKTVDELWSDYKAKYPQ